MPFATMSAIAKALHPDHGLGEETRVSAYKLFTAWQRTSKPKAESR
jgi:hypothetical protein